MLPLTYIFNENKDFKNAWLFYNQGIYSSKTWNLDYFTDKYKSLHFITNAKQINNDSKVNANYSDVPTTTFISEILKYYAKTPNVKFDIWIAEPSLLYFWNSKNQEFYSFFKRINKINVVADGNYQIYTFMSRVLNRYNSKGYIGLGKTQDEINSKRDEYLKDNNNSKFLDFQKYNSIDWVRDTNLFNVFNVYPYTKSSYYNNVDKNKTSLYNTYFANYNYYQTAIDLFGKNNNDKIESFCNDYETIFNSNNKYKITDFFWKNSDKYDPKKKNLIVLGDSLTESKGYESLTKKAELNKMFEAFFNFYSPSEYNIIFKNHPRLSTESKQKEYVEFALNDDSDVSYFINTPWEVVLSWDYKEQSENKNYVPLFSYASKPSQIRSVIVSPQFSTTSIQSTTSFLQNTYDYSLDDLGVVANPINFPIPYTYDYIYRESQTKLSKEKQILLNKNHADKIYQPIVDLGLFPDFKSKQVDTDTLYNESVKYKNNFLNQKNKKMEKIALISSVSVIVPIAIISSVTAFIVLNKKKKQKIIKPVIKKR